MPHLPIPDAPDEWKNSSSVADVISINANDEPPEDSNSENELAMKDARREHVKVLILALIIFAITIGVTTLLHRSENSNGATRSEPAVVQDAKAFDALQTELDETEAKLVNVSDAFTMQGEEFEDLRSEFTQTSQALELAPDPEEIRSLEAQLEEQTNLTTLATEEVARKAKEAARQTEVATQLQIDLDAEAAARADAEAQANRAQARAEVEVAQAKEALADEVSTIPARIEGTFGLLDGVSLNTTVYELDEVGYWLQRSGFQDDERQYFDGTGEIGLKNNLDKVSANWLGNEVLQVVLPLPEVADWDTTRLVGEYRTVREQFARIGARWGEQTEYFVTETAQRKTRELACNDATALRESMNKVKQLAYQMGQGYSMNVRWMDSSGFVRSNVSTAQLLNNAC